MFKYGVTNPSHGLLVGAKRFDLFGDRKLVELIRFRMAAMLCVALEKAIGLLFSSGERI